MNSHWISCTISDLGTVVGGSTPSTKVSENYTGGKIPWITPKDLAGYNHRYISRGERNITEQGFKSSSLQMLPQHSVLFTSRAPIGYIAIAENDLCTNQGFKSVVPNSETDYMFLYYLLKFNKENIENMGSGTTFKEVSGTTMRNIPVFVPEDKQTQQRIASILSALDSKIEQNTAINNNLEQQAQALITDYVSKTPGVTSIGNLLSFVNGFAFKSGDYLAKGLYKIITIKNVQDGLVDSQGAAGMDDLPVKLPSDCKLNIGDVLLSLTGNVGRVGIVTENNLLLNQRVAKVKPKNDELLPFIYFVLRLPAMKTEMENISKGTAQQNLSPIETLKLQLNFEESTAVELSHTLFSMFNQIVHNMTENRHLSEIRDTLLPKLMSGEIDVSKVDISDPSCLDKSLFSGE